MAKVSVCVVIQCKETCNRDAVAVASCGEFSPVVVVVRTQSCQ